MDLGKIRIPHIALGLVIALATSGLSHTGFAQKGDPGNHRGRLLFVFGPDENNKAVLDQYQRNERAAGAFDGADVDVVYVIGDHLVKMPPPNVKTVSADELRKHYHVDATGFRIVLVGDDGWEKRRWTEPTDPTTIVNRAPDMPKPKSALDSK
jgi:Domain of unknown function (DUF4174)